MPAGSQALSTLDARRKNEKSRDLRSKLRCLTETIRNDGEDLADHSKNLLTDRVRELDNLSKQVERPSEQADDSEAFYTLTQRGAEMAKRMAAGKGRTANDFIRHLTALFADESNGEQDLSNLPNAFNWRRLSKAVDCYFRHAPGVSCMLGPMDATIKAKKQAQRIQRKPVGKAVAPQVLQAEDPEAQEKRETERNMETMWKVLKPHTDGVGLLELTMNCKSFAQFAENNFTLAFLVHNKRAQILESEKNARGLLVFPYSEKAAQKEGKAIGQGKDRSQFILACTVADWQRWKQYVREGDCLMPHRAERDYEAEMAATGRFAHEQRGAAAEQGESSSDEDGPGPSKRRADAGRRKPDSRAAQPSRTTQVKPEPRDDDEADDDSDDSEEELLVKPTQNRKRLRKTAGQ